MFSKNILDRKKLSQRFNGTESNADNYLTKLKEKC
jgi:hypothetical protein